MRSDRPATSSGRPHEPRGPNRCPNLPTILHDQSGQKTCSSPAHSPPSGAWCATLVLGTPPIDVQSGRALANRPRAGGACLRATCRVHCRARVRCARNESEIQRERG
eukprot:4216019-Prymnesium_polylepis.1